MDERWRERTTRPTLGPVPALVEPLVGPWRRTLRAAVLQHATGEHRRRHLPLVHVGRPGAHECVVPAIPADGEPDDHALRTDVLAALLRRVGDCEPAPGPLVWLTRAGDLDLQDVDAAWLAAARAAASEADVDLTMVVVDRHGWRDPRTGLQQHWVRLRPAPRR